MTEVFFCNFCDQSVPQSKLDAGDAIRHGGRVVCPTCCDTLLLATRGGTERSGGGGGGRMGTLVAVIVGLIGWAGAGWVWTQQEDLRHGLADDVVAEAVARQDAVDALGDRMDALSEEGRAGREDLAVAVAAVQERLGALADDLEVRLDRLDAAVEPVPTIADAAEDARERLELVETNQTLVEDSLRDLRSAQQFLRDSLAELERKVELGAAAAPEESGFASDVQALLDDLDDADELNRVAALEKLSQVEDPRLVPYVEPLLEDPYEMNRFYAAYTLGEWGATKSVPALIETLNDEYSFVRKAANEALMAITGEDQGFEHKAAEAERRKAYERWKQWWQSQRGESAADAGGGTGGR